MNRMVELFKMFPPEGVKLDAGVKVDKTSKNI